MLSAVAAVALIVAGPVVGLIPGPGGLVVLVFGVALLAAEFRPAAQLLDWLESKLRVIWTKVKQLGLRRRAADRL